MRERFESQEFPARSLRDVVDELFLEKGGLNSIVDRPRSFKIASVNKQELFAPTALPFEMSLNRVGSSLVATTGSEKQVPTDFGVTGWRSHLMSEGSKKERIESIKVLAQADIDTGKGSGWAAHWHPIGTAARIHMPSFGDFAVATHVGGIHFAIDEQGISVYRGARSEEHYEELRKQKEETNLAIASRTDQIRHLNTQLLNADMDFLIREADLKQVEWSDSVKIDAICDFMNGRISEQDLEETLSTDSALKDSNLRPSR